MAKHGLSVTLSSLVLAVGAATLTWLHSCSSDGTGGGDGNGVAEVLTLQGDGGAVDLSLDGRSRPVAIAGPSGSATLTWSEDGRTVDARITSDGVESHVSVSVDLSDEALLAAADDWEAETGQDLSDFRTFIQEYPGLVSQVAAGDLSRLPAKPVRQMQEQQGSVTRHLVRLRLGFSNLMRFTNEWIRERQLANDVPEPAFSNMIRMLRDTTYILYIDYLQQLNACTACNADCRADCHGDSITGACCHDDLTCEDNVAQTTCQGYFREGLACVDVDCTTGCCCVDVDGPVTPFADFNQPPRLSPSTFEACDLERQGLNEPGGLEGTVIFFPGRESCEGVPCNE